MSASSTEPVPMITETWSEDGLKLTVTGTYPDGEEAQISVTWATRELAEENAAGFRDGARNMLMTRSLDLEVISGRVKRGKARRVGPFMVGIGRGYPFQPIPEFTTKKKVGIRWGTGYIVIAYRPRSTS